MLLVLAGVEGPVRGDPVDQDQGAVQDHIGPAGFLRVPDRAAELRGAGLEQGHGLLDIPPGRGPADPEPRRQLRERLALAQVCQDQERLLPRAQLPLARPDRLAVPPDAPGREAESLTGQRQRSTVEKHGSPRWR